MINEETVMRIAELTEKISELPKGYISKKTVCGNVYFYHQWSENGIKRSKYLRGDEIAELAMLIGQRKKLKKELSALKADSFHEGEEEQDILKTTLMYKSFPVAEIVLDAFTGDIRRINTVYESELLPEGVNIDEESEVSDSLNTWWQGRAIPASRERLREALEALDKADTVVLLFRFCGLCLSDRYWLRPAGSGLEWKDICFFQTDFHF